MASSGTTTTGSVVTLVGADNEVVLVDDVDSIGIGVICQKRTISEAFISLGSDTAHLKTSDEDMGATICVGLEVKIPTMGTEEGCGAGGV